MRTLSIVVIGLSAYLVSPIILAKGKEPNKQKDPHAMAEMYQKLATPGEPHKVLKKLVGNWKTTTKEWTEPGKPSAETTGTADFKMVLGDRFLQEDYVGQMMGQPFSGLSICGYDNLRKKYVSLWMSTADTGISTMEGTGSADGKTITFKGAHQTPEGGQIQHRAVWSIVDDDKQTYDVYGKRKGAKEMKMMEITLTRAK